jgi:uncharacterized protein YndB with AHSA1/START domain
MEIEGGKMPEPSVVHAARLIQAAPAEVCRGFTHQTLLHEWLCQQSSSEPQPGGHLFLHWRNGRTVTGAYEQLDLPRWLRFSWSEAGLPGPTVVEVACQAEGESTRLSLTHSGRDAAAGLGEAARG